MTLPNEETEGGEAKGVNHGFEARVHIATGAGDGAPLVGTNWEILVISS